MKLYTKVGYRVVNFYGVLMFTVDPPTQFTISSVKICSVHMTIEQVCGRGLL